MTLIKGIFRVLLVLLVQSAIWSISVCKPIEKAALLSQDGDLFGPYFSQNPLWPPTFAPPFVWPTYDPAIWTRRRRDFYDNHKTKADMPIGLRVLIFILIGIAGLVALLCKYYVCKTDASSRTSEPAVIAHSPPSRISTTGLNRSSQQLQNRATPEDTTPSTSLLSRTTQQFHNRTVPIDTGASNIYHVSDKPPSYSDVVISDLIDGTLKFPEVYVTAPRESPPPKYEKGGLM